LPTAAANPSLTTRYNGLDTLRALAIVAVMAFHRFGRTLPDSLAPVSHLGWMGVDLFFVLSGYLIGSQLLRPIALGRRLELWSFYRKRLYRVLPAYLVVVALYFLLPAWREDPGVSPLWEYLTFTENLFVDYGKNQAFSHVWSLCVEEHFYLFLPIIVLLLARKPALWKTVTTLAAFLIAGIAVRGFIVLHTLQPLARAGQDWDLPYMERLYYPTWNRLDGLLAGVALALIQHFRPAWWASLRTRGHRLLLAGSALIGLAIWLLVDRWDSVFGRPAVGDIIGFPIASLGLALVVASALSQNSLLARARIPGAKTIAILAYSLYLTHKAIFDLTNRLFPNLEQTGGLLWFAASASACLIAAAILHLAIERPFLTLRDRHSTRAAITQTIESEPAL
jgi:peptidoglycan/LPS O-acetylase OafA/YrhL